MRAVAVTGTNGKTTTCSMIAAIVAAHGEPSARVTTLGAFLDDECVDGEATSNGFARLIARAREAGVRTLAVETTSEALEKGFARTFPIDVGVFTNLSRDHLDYHGTPERYLAAKAQLFLALAPGAVAVLNAADESSALLDEVASAGVERRAFAGKAVDPACAGLALALAAERVEVDRTGTRVRLAASPLADRLGRELSLRVVGDVHAENALAAAVAADALGYPASSIARGLARFVGVPGRFEIVTHRPLVVVDFAHTPDALERTLRAAAALVGPDGGRVVCVFGCGGDRDRGKRPEMGRIAAELAAAVVVTTDNPRSEDPEAIADAVVAGARGRSACVARMSDREAAIRHAIGLAEPRDAVVVAGKGHEKVQVLAAGSVPFDDVAVVRRALGELGMEGR